ncbi:MAG: hypothetical protein KatS3mg015_2904 [Fimbriimonadales bacterium]|nr:MAG: hypothetical protein KatS3mg015_2904 [Fimbriimonadales bacterium]
MQTLDHLEQRDRLYVPTWAIRTAVSVSVEETSIERAEQHNDAIDGVYDGPISDYRRSDTDTTGASYIETTIVLGAIAARYAQRADSADAEWERLTQVLSDLVEEMANLARKQGSRLIPSVLRHVTMEDSDV